MRLLEKYLALEQDPVVFAAYTTSGRGQSGKMFAFQNTNYRKALSFITNYWTFKNGADGVARSKWELAGHGQEALKQHTVNMLKSRFFSKNEDMYYHTRKGEALEQVAGTFSAESQEEERWILMYLLLMDAYFDDVPNYILQRSQEITDLFLVQGLSREALVEMEREFVQRAQATQGVTELFRTDYIYFDTFYQPVGGVDFLAAYVAAPAEEKLELWDYVAQGRYLGRTDCLNQKYKSSGVGARNTVIDDAKILLMSNFVLTTKFRDFGDFVRRVVEEYAKVVEIDVEKVVSFVLGEYRDVFEMCYLNVFDPEFFESDSEAGEDRLSEAGAPEEATDTEVVERVRETAVVENADDLKKVREILKREALRRSDYRCELEELYDCAAHYFTSRKTGRNYLEVHHLVPREFSNDFEHSIEQIENYVALCPHCHRMLHNAADRERKPALNCLFAQRSAGLAQRGVPVEKEQLLRYYKVETE